MERLLEHTLRISASRLDHVAGREVEKRVNKLPFARTTLVVHLVLCLETIHFA
jgi:hypothetical protein